MYFPDPARILPAEAGLDSIEEIEIATADGVTLVAWQAPAKADKPTILYFHGNGANAANRASKIHTILESGLGVFYLNNRSEAHTSELQSHVNVVCRLLFEKKNVLLGQDVR